MNRAIAVFASVAALTAGPALADCVSESTSAQVKRAFAQGEAHEKAGRDREAVLQYFAAQEYTCDAPNTRSAEAAKRAAPLALRAGRAAETKGDLAEAYRIYEAGGQYSAADRVLVAQVRAKPDDLQLFDTARQHFSNRDLPAHAANNKERIAAAGPYTLDRTQLDFVMRQPAEGIERALKKDAALFSEAYLRDYEAMMRERHTLAADMSSYSKIQATQQGFLAKWPDDRLKQSRDALATARDWMYRWLPADAATKAAGQKIDARALQRGDTLAQKFSGAPEVLESAMQYYRFAQQDPKVAAVKTQAGQLGAKAEAQGALRLAAKYYDTADDDKRAQAAEARAKAQQQAAMQPTIDAMQKQAAEAQKAYSDPAKVEEMKRRAREVQEQMRKQQQAGAKEKSAKSAEELEKELGM